MSRRRTAAVAVAAMLALTSTLTSACGEATGADSDQGFDASAWLDDALVDAGPGSIAPPQNLPSALECFESVCGPVELSAAANDGGRTYLPAVACALGALADATPEAPARIEVGYDPQDDFRSFTTLVVPGRGRTVLRQDVFAGGFALPPERSVVSSCELVDAEYFRDCLQAPSLACLDLETWFVSCAETPDARCP